MELLRLCMENKRNLEEAVWLIARGALDAGNDPEEVATILGCSCPTMYRKLRERGLTYGRGRVGE